MTSLNVLFISPYVPSPIRVRPYNIIKYLAKHGHKITLLLLIPPGEDIDSLDELHSWCRVVKTVSLPRWRTLWNAIRAAPSRTPLQAAYSRSPEMTDLIKRTLKETKFDVVHIEHLRGSELSCGVDNTPIVFDSVDSITLLFQYVSTSGPNWRSRLMAKLELSRTQHYEGELLKRYSRVLVTSPKDKNALVELSTVPVADRFEVMPNGVDLDYFKPMDVVRDPATLIFTGKMSYHANIATALDLAQHIMPLVWKQNPETKLIIAGKDPAPELLSLTSDPRIIVTGTVPDLRPYLAKATVAISPMRYGVGIQNKILEAMAMGTPVITSSHALISIQAQADQDLLIADNPETIAQAVVRLLSNKQLAQQIGQAGLQYVQNYHDWDVTVKKLENVYQEVLSTKNGHNAS